MSLIIISRRQLSGARNCIQIRNKLSCQILKISPPKIGAFYFASFFVISHPLYNNTNTTNMSKVTGKRKRSDTADIHELMAKEDLVEFGVATLKAYCKENGLGSTGTADKLIGNILAHFRGDKENHSPQLDGKNILME